MHLEHHCRLLSRTKRRGHLFSPRPCFCRDDTTIWQLSHSTSRSTTSNKKTPIIACVAHTSLYHYTLPKFLHFAKVNYHQFLTSYLLPKAELTPKQKIFLPPPPYISPIPTVYPHYTYPLPILKVKNTTKSPIYRKIYYKKPNY